MTRTVYRYRSLRGDGLGQQWELIVHGVLHFPTPPELNDPCECRPPRFRLTEPGVRAQIRSMHTTRGVPPEKLDEEVERTMRNGDVMNPLHWDHVRQGLIADASTVGIVCFSEIRDSVPMWSLYADSHRGICIRFELPEALPEGGALFPVRYADDVPTWEIGTDKEDFVTTTFLTKARHWEYEREWRFVDHRRDPTHPKKVVKPYSITGISLGARIEPAHAEIIKGWVRDSGQEVEVSRARIVPDTYKLELDPEPI